MSHENRNNRPSSYNELRRFNSICQFVDKCFEIRSRLLVLRLDFSYREDMCPDLQTVVRQRDRLLRYLREPYDQQYEGAYIGMMWKLEYGQDKGYHLHTLIVLDGSRLLADYMHAKLIGEYWKHYLTQGDGLYHNCNAEKKKYRYCGIGMVKHSDLVKRNYLLNYAASYLAKEDKLMQEMILMESKRMAAFGEVELARQIAKTRCFGKTPLPARREDVPCRGRPRSSDTIRW